MLKAFEAVNSLCAQLAVNNFAEDQADFAVREICLSTAYERDTFPRRFSFLFFHRPPS